MLLSNSGQQKSIPLSLETVGVDALFAYFINSQQIALKESITSNREVKA